MWFKIIRRITRIETIATSRRSRARLASLCVKAAQLALRKDLEAKEPFTLSEMDCKETPDNAVGERSGPATRVLCNRGDCDPNPDLLTAK